MIQENQQLPLRLLGAIFGSLLIALPAIAQMNSSSSKVKQLPLNGDPPLPPQPIVVPQAPPSSERQLPTLPSAVPVPPPGVDTPLPPQPSPVLQTPPASDRPLPPLRSVPQTPPASDRPLPPLRSVPQTPPASDRPLPPLPSPFPEIPPGSDRNAPQPRPLPQVPPGRDRNSPPPRPLLEIPPATLGPSPPLPEQLGPPSATITPFNGMVNVKLVNETGAIITFQVLSDTNERSLPGRADVTLRNLKTPVNITFQRPDGGLILVIPQADSEPGMLRVTLRETTNLGDDKKAMTIEENGNVFLN
jgi:hypothetical protein